MHLIPRAAAFFGGGVILLAGVSFISILAETKNPQSHRRFRLVVHRAAGFRNATYSRANRALHYFDRLGSVHRRRFARRSGNDASDRSGTGGFPPRRVTTLSSMRPRRS